MFKVKLSGQKGFNLHLSFGLDFSWNKPDMDTTEWSPNDEVAIYDRSFRLAIGLLFWVLEIKTGRNIYEIKKEKYDPQSQF